MTLEGSLNILLIDDEDLIYQTIDNYLRDSGHKVDESHNISGALELISEHDYDVAVIDATMSCGHDLSFVMEFQKTCPKNG